MDLNRTSDLIPALKVLRQNIHAHPEIRYEEHRTSSLVATQLKDYGVDEVVTGIGKTGVVALIRGKGTSKKGIGLRADMDALPIIEDSTLTYKSTIAGKMHACGHDGHTAMLLGAAQELARTRNFSGTAVLIFQPAEEGGAGAKAMIDDGLLSRFPIDEIYGMHNMPGLTAGRFAIRAGALMAASDTIDIIINGKGAHAGRPHQGIDPVLIASQIVTGLQSLVARRTDPLQSAVISICQFNAGNADNVIPQSAHLRGTMRTFSQDVRTQLQDEMLTLVESMARAFGANARLTLTDGYPVVVNHETQTGFAARVAQRISGNAPVDVDVTPMMGAEDFAFYLQERPGAFIFAGNGGSAPLHHPQYDFNDALLPTGIAYWVELVETALPLNT